MTEEGGTPCATATPAGDEPAVNGGTPEHTSGARARATLTADLVERMNELAQDRLIERVQPGWWVRTYDENCEPGWAYVRACLEYVRRDNGRKWRQLLLLVPTVPLEQGDCRNWNNSPITCLLKPDVKKLGLPDLMAGG